MSVDVIKTDGLPSVYINSPCLITDGSWRANAWSSATEVNAGDRPLYTDGDMSPEVFPFSYKRVAVAEKREVANGILYDFSQELFGRLVIENAAKDSCLHISYGESEAEALSPDWAVLFEDVHGALSYTLRSRAFRYVYITGVGVEQLSLHALHEFLPCEDKACFSCEQELVNRIWEASAHTFHLNSREFFFDGIKRDRWVWAGDAYQAFFVNQYLQFDCDLTRRTITALLGKPPYYTHINTINDYSYYTLISLYEYYFATGDRDFIEFIFPRAKALYDFCVARLDGDGPVCKQTDDWIFIDCAASGREHVTRHANIFAILYDFVDDDKQRLIKEKVLDNPKIAPITTPYFSFFELRAYCKMGEISLMQKRLESYYGGMIKLGAATVWEAYDPTHAGEQHYAMYGNPYEKSLCHAWGSGPIYLLGRYCLGVCSTEVGYRSFEIKPCAGLYGKLVGRVPLPDGYVDIALQVGVLTVTSTCPGGYVMQNGLRIDIPVNKTVSFAYRHEPTN